MKDGGDAASFTKLLRPERERAHGKAVQAVRSRQVQHGLRHYPGSYCFEQAGSGSDLCLLWPPTSLCGRWGPFPGHPGACPFPLPPAPPHPAPGCQGKQEPQDFRAVSEISTAQKSLPVWGLHSSRRDRQDSPRVLDILLCQNRRSLGCFH